MKTLVDDPPASESPVFVVGCARSGTTLLYHMLVSSGGFADYRAETHLYDMVLPRYGSMESPQERLKLLRDWCSSRQASTVDLGEDDLRDAVLEDCRSGGDFLRLLMGRVAEDQGTPRWAECTPLHLLYMDRIKKEIPDALFLHSVRDGRDVALSMSEVGWVNPLPWDRGWQKVVAAWEWEWRVQSGRRLASELGEDCREVRFEDLVLEPEQTLESLEEFVGYPLDYEVILKNAVGTVADPNTAFEQSGRETASRTDFRPVGRWREHPDRASVAGMEATVGESLEALGYDVGREGPGASYPFTLRMRKKVYQKYRGVRQWAKDHTPLSRWLTLAPTWIEREPGLEGGRRNTAIQSDVVSTFSALARDLRSRSAQPEVNAEKNVVSSHVLCPTSVSEPFYTPEMGKWQMLPNGNLLFTEGQAGRVVEVTPDGRTVWQWIAEPYKQGTVAEVTEGTRYPLSADEVAQWSCFRPDPTDDAQEEAP